MLLTTAGIFTQLRAKVPTFQDPISSIYGHPTASDRNIQLLPVRDPPLWRMSLFVVHLPLNFYFLFIHVRVITGSPASEHGMGGISIGIWSTASRTSEYFGLLLYAFGVCLNERVFHNRGKNELCGVFSSLSIYQNRQRADGRLRKWRYFQLYTRTEPKPNIHVCLR